MVTHKDIIKVKHAKINLPVKDMLETGCASEVFEELGDAGPAEVVGDTGCQ